MKHSCSPSSQFLWAFFRLYGSWQKILPHWIPSVQHPQLRHPSLRSWSLHPLLDAPVLHQTLAVFILMSSEQLFVCSHRYSSSSFPCPATCFLELSRHEIKRNQRASKAASGLLTSHCLGKGTGSCTSLFSLLSPRFLATLTWGQLSSVKSKQVHVPKHFQMPAQVML